MAITDIAPPAIGEGLDALRQPIKRAEHAPGYVYSSPEVLALEKENVYMKDWLFIGREEELEKPGDYLTFHVVGEPIVITRDQDGQLNAFSNVDDAEIHLHPRGGMRIDYASCP